MLNKKSVQATYFLNMADQIAQTEQIKIEIENLRKPFVPEENGLDAAWRLTKYSDLKGWGCKVPQETLHKLLAGLNQSTTTTQLTTNDNLLTAQKPQAAIGIGLDSCVIPNVYVAGPNKLLGQVIM